MILKLCEIDPEKDRCEQDVYLRRNKMINDNI